VIAVLRFKASPLEAHLDDNGEWIANDDTLEKLLNARFNPVLFPPSPAAGISEFAAQAREAARQLGGELEWLIESDSEDQGRIH
jgi:hypothetical protein